MNETGSRVKLFLLDDVGQWIDRGIGLASITQKVLEIHNEDTFELANSFVIEDITPHRQSETILCWTDSVLNNYALSFQQIEGAEMFWNSFCEIHRIAKGSKGKFLPPIEENLDKIVEFLNCTLDIKDLTGDWLEELNKNVLENIENQECMKKFFEVYKILINLGKINVYEGLLLSESYVAVFKVLEFDSEISFKQNFPNYFAEEVKFNNFLKITDKKFLDLVNLAHRVLCLKEALMSRSFKDPTIQILWNFQIKLWNDIIMYFVNLAEARSSLLLSLSENNLSGYLLLSEALHFSKFINDNSRGSFYEALKNDGILKTLQKKWQFEHSDQVKIRRVILEAFYCIALLSPKLVIDSFTDLSEKLYIQILKDSIISDIESMQKTSELLKLLMQSQNFAIYPIFFKSLYDDVILSYLPLINVNIITSDSYDSVHEILSIISHCLLNDSFTIRYFFITNNVINLVNLIIKDSIAALKISAIKTLKAILVRKDSFLINIMIKSETITVILDTFTSVHNKEGVLFSCILSFFNDIKKNDHWLLIDYVKNMLNDYDFPEIGKIFASDKRLTPIEVRRSRTISFDLTAQEKFTDLEADYSEFLAFDENNQRIDANAGGDLVLGKRPQSEYFAKPEKKPKRSE
ncbi:hypothetical protein SteCoe_336 [Stentor coeruleus]|uniref:Uncharacterized protein n=1 Tax=Stentor coeruleus TaxID=5963 RepID=A0A1R2D4G8_9CILI|nr:hypothetical protein SteCoe_336 [Stentor coeruleus]